MNRKWRRIAISTAGILLSIVGIPGLIEDGKTWREWVQLLPGAWWNWLFAIAGLGLLLYAVWPGIKRTFGRKEKPASAAVYYIDACAIVDSYINPALPDKSDIIKLTIRQDFIQRFEKVTGAMLGEGLYNRQLLHQWMQSNAARFLVEHRNEML